MHHMNEWLAHERGRELRLEADERRRARRSEPTRIRSVLRRRRSDG